MRSLEVSMYTTWQRLVHSDPGGETRSCGLGHNLQNPSLATAAARAGGPADRRRTVFELLVMGAVSGQQGPVVNTLFCVRCVRIDHTNLQGC